MRKKQNSIRVLKFNSKTLFLLNNNKIENNAQQLSFIILLKFIFKLFKIIYISFALSLSFNLFYQYYSLNKFIIFLYPFDQIFFINNTIIANNLFKIFLLVSLISIL